MSITPLEAFEKAIDEYGSQSAMAIALGVDQTTISKRLAASKEVVAEWVLRIERDTKIPRHVLRPDIYPCPHGLDNISGEWMDEYGNRHPILDKHMERA